MVEGVGSMSGALVGKFFARRLWSRVGGADARVLSGRWMRSVRLHSSIGRRATLQAAFWFFILLVFAAPTIAAETAPASTADPRISIHDGFVDENAGDDPRR
jgi:hypothetical protein